MELISNHPRAFLNYLKTAKVEKYKQLNHINTSLSNKIGQKKLLESYYQGTLLPLINLTLNEPIGFVDNMPIFFHDAFSRVELSQVFGFFHLWMLAQCGSEFDSQCVTDTIELGFSTIESPTETKDTSRNQNAVKKEHDLAPILLVEERKLALEGFRSFEYYNMKAKNKWEIQKNNPAVIKWTGTIAIKKLNGTYQQVNKEDTLDFSPLNLKDEEKKIALKFVQEYCQNEKRVKVFYKRSFSEAPPFLRKILVENDAFWLWIDAKSPSTDQNVENYQQLINQISPQYQKLITICERFENTINDLLIEALVEGQDMENVSQAMIESTEKESQYLDDELEDEEDIMVEAGFIFLLPDEANVVPDSNKSASYPLDFLSPIQNTLNAVYSYLPSPQQLISSATTAILFLPSMAIDYIRGKIEVPDAPWVKTKYALALSQIFKLFATEIAQRNDWQTPLGNLLCPVFDLKEENPRLAHTIFLEKLRTLLISESYQTELTKKIKGFTYDPLVDTVLKLCQARFEEGNLYTFCDNLINEILPGSPNELLETDFEEIDHVDPSKKLSSLEVNAKKALGHFNINFDPHLQGNIPFVLGTVDIGNKPVKLLRMGTPTIEPRLLSRAKINPEFTSYIQALKLQNKKHLYISLQNDKIKSYGTGDESGRNNAIKGLQKDFPDTFYAVVLAQDSHFYKQVDKQGSALGNQDSNLFKRTFYSELTGINTGFYFPDDWKKDDEFSYGLNNLLEHVHKTVFMDDKGQPKEILTRQEKQDFIEIYYAYLSIFLMNYSEADNANVTCKDGIDRAGKLNSLILKLIMTIQGKASNKKHLRIHQVFTHSPAFLVKSQAIIKSHSKDTSNGRRERYMSAHEVLTDNRVMKKIQENNILIRKLHKTTKLYEDFLLINPEGDITITEDPSQAIAD